MKTPSDWLNALPSMELGDVLPWIVEIQAEAFKAGMTRAAEIALIRPKGQQAAIDIMVERKKLP